MMLSLLVTLLVIIIVCVILYVLVGKLPLLTPQWRQIAQFLVILIALVWILQALGLFGHPWRAHLGG